MLIQTTIKFNLAVIFACRMMSALLIFGLYRLMFSDPFLAQYASGWVALYIAIAGISTMDLGVGAGLKNALIGNAGFGISRAPFLYGYSVIGVVACLIFFSFVSLSAPSVRLIREAESFAAILFGFVIFIYPMMRFGVSYHQAHKREWLVAPVFLLVNFLLILLVWFSSVFQSETLLTLSLPLAFVSPLFVLFIYRFNPVWERDKPNESFFLKFRYLELGKPFIAIQIAVFVMVALNDALIARFAERDLRDYQVLYRYFSIMAIISSIISMVIWSNVGRKALDFDFHFRVRSIVMSFVGLSVCSWIMLLVTDDLLLIWLGESVEVEGDLQVALFCLAQSTLFIVAGFLNAQGRIGPQARWLAAVTVVKIVFVLVSLYTASFDALNVVAVSTFLLLAVTLRLSFLYIFER